MAKTAIESREAKRHPPHDEHLRQRLHRVASELLATGGPSALSVRRVAKLAGTSTTAIYSLFGSKEELLKSLCREGSRALADAMSAVPRTDDPTADVVAMGHAYRRWALGSPLTYQILFGGALSGLDFDSKDQDELRDGLTQLVETVARCVESGRYREGSPAEVGFVLWGLVHGLVGLELNGHLEPDAADAAFGAALEMATRGLSAA